MTTFEIAGLIGGVFTMTMGGIATVKSLVEDTGLLSRKLFSNCVVRPVGQGKSWPGAFSADVDWILEVEIANRGDDGRDLRLFVDRVEVRDGQGHRTSRSIAEPIRLQPMDGGTAHRIKVRIPPAPGRSEPHGPPNRLAVDLRLQSRRPVGPRRMRRAEMEIDGPTAHSGDMTFRV